MKNLFNDEDLLDEDPLWILTEEEQKEIRKYLRDRLTGAEIDLSKLPNWLAELEVSRQLVDRMRRLVSGKYTSMSSDERLHGRYDIHGTDTGEKK